MKALFIRLFLFCFLFPMGGSAAALNAKLLFDHLPVTTQIIESQEGLKKQTKRYGLINCTKVGKESPKCFFGIGTMGMKQVNIEQTFVALESLAKAKKVNPEIAYSAGTVFTTYHVAGIVCSKIDSGGSKLYQCGIGSS